MPAAQLHNAPKVPMRQFRLVQGTEQRHVAFFRQTGKQRQNLLTPFRIERRHRLIRQQQHRLLHQCPGDGYALMFAAR